jgi:hypothetical protein
MRQPSQFLMKPSSRAASRRCCARLWLGIWLILINLLGAPFAHATAHHSGRARVRDTLAGLPYEICGAVAGAGLVAGDGDGAGDGADPARPAPASPARHTADCCVLCLPLLHGAASAPVLPSPPVGFVDTPIRVTMTAAPPRRLAGIAHGARAPPV